MVFPSLSAKLKSSFERTLTFPLPSIGKLRKFKVISKEWNLEVKRVSDYFCCWKYVLIAHSLLKISHTEKSDVYLPR